MIMGIFGLVPPEILRDMVKPSEKEPDHHPAVDPLVCHT